LNRIKQEHHDKVQKALKAYDESSDPYFMELMEMMGKERKDKADFIKITRR